MDVREKLVELCEDLETLPCCATYEEQAEYLISHGVTVQKWALPEEEYYVLLREKERRMTNESNQENHIIGACKAHS